MRLGMSAVRGAGATPPAPGLVQNDQGQWGHYEIPPGSELTTFVPYVSPSNLTPNHSVMPTGDGTQGTGDSTPGTQGTGDSSMPMQRMPGVMPMGGITNVSMPNPGSQCPPGYHWAVDPSGQSAPPPPDLVRNERGQLGRYVAAADAPPGFATGSAEIVFVPYQPTPKYICVPDSPNQSTTSPLRGILPTLRQVIPCAPNWTPRAYGGPNLKPPSLNQAPVTYLAGAGAASGGFHADLTFADVLSWAAFGLGALVGSQVIDNIYERRRVA